MTPENSPRQTSAAERLELIKLGHERHPGADDDALTFAILAIAVAEGKNIEDFLDQGETTAASTPKPIQVSANACRVWDTADKVWRCDNPMKLLDLIKQVRMSRNPVLAGVKELLDKGVMRIEGRGRSTVYRLVVPFLR